jgi:predicted DNA-binding protein (UPF0278 family)
VTKPQIAVRVPSSLFEELNSYVEKNGVSKTDVVISAIATYLGCVKDLPLRQRIVDLETRIATIETKMEVK